MAAEQVETFEKAKELLIGAVDTVFQVANQLRTHDHSSPVLGAAVPVAASTPRSTTHSVEAISYGLPPGSVRNAATLPMTGCHLSPQIPRCSDLTNVQRPGTAAGIVSQATDSTSARSVGLVGLQEHRRLFKFQPSKATKRGKGSGRNVPPKMKRGKRGPSTWKKDCICLSCCDQLSVPNTEERMKLARMGLGLKELTLDVDGGPMHIHETIQAMFPQLEAGGGYSLLRLSESSRDLVEIESPEGGLTVPYLKDIVRQAKLYIRPLQCDIQADVKPTIVQVSQSPAFHEYMHIVSLCIL